MAAQQREGQRISRGQHFPQGWRLCCQ